MFKWNMSCQELTELISEDMDRKVSFFRKIKMLLHLYMCGYCIRFKKQILILREACRSDIPSVDESVCMSPQAIDRIKNNLQTELAKQKFSD